MINSDKNNPETNKTNFNPVVAAVIGATVGAGVAVAGAAVLKDEKNRAKIKKVLDSVKNEAVGYMKNMHKQMAEKKEKVKMKEAIDTRTEKMQKVAHSAKKSLDQGVKEAREIIEKK